MSIVHPTCLCPSHARTGAPPSDRCIVWWGRDRDYLEFTTGYIFIPPLSYLLPLASSSSVVPQNEDDVLQRSVKCREVIQEPDSSSTDLVAVWAGGVGWKGDVTRDISLSCPLRHLLASSSRRFVSNVAIAWC